MLKTLYRQIGRYMTASVLTPVFTSLEVVMDVLIPYVTAFLIDKGLNAGNMANVYRYGLIMIMMAFLSLAFGILAGRYASYASTGFAANLRKAMYRNIQTFSFADIDKYSTSGLVTRMTTDIQNLQNAFQQILRVTVRAPFRLILSIVMCLVIDAQLSLIFVVAMVVLSVSLYSIISRVARLFQQVFERYDALNQSVQENVRAIRVVKAFVREDFEIDRFHEQNELNFRAQMKDAQLSSLLTPTVEFLAALAVTVIIWFGGKEVVDGVITAGTLVAFLTYAVNLANPVKRLSRIYAQIQKAMAGADRVFALLDTEETVTSSPDAKRLPPVEGRVAFSNVDFSYREDVPALTGVTFTAEPGQMIAFVGPSGAGKSTVANLIPRFYDVTGGSITIDGHDVREVTTDSLRTQIGLVPQETVLFSATVRENIRYGRLDATDSEIEAAAKSANAHDFIMALPEGYDTEIGERGATLSGGQRQRIAIARAILKDPKILILDEATSALDTESEKIVQAALDRLMVGRTSFVIAHRLSTIINADRIYVLDGGRIREQGTHEELLTAGGLYAGLYHIQYDKT